MKVIPSVDGQSVLAQSTATQCEKAIVDAGKASEDRKIKRMPSVDEVTAPGVRSKLEKIQRLCEDEREMVSTSVAEMTKLFREVAKKKRYSVKLTDRSSDLERVLGEMWSVKRLVYVNFAVMSACIKNLEV